MFGLKEQQLLVEGIREYFYLSSKESELTPTLKRLLEASD